MTGTIGDRFRHAVATHGRREALVHRGARWTYADLGELVGGATRELRAVAGGPPRRVGIVGINHPAYVAGYFAAQCLGAVTVEVGRDESLGALCRALAAAEVDLVLTDRDDLRDAIDRPCIAFEPFLAASRTPAALPAPATPALDHEAAIVFTSGTTGDPKGVVLTHGSILFVIDAVVTYLGLVPEDRYALVLPLSHTYGKSNLLTAVAAGAAVVTVESIQDPEAFLSGLARERCSVLSVVPFHLNVLARRGLPDGLDFRALRAITSSGGPLPATTAATLAGLLPDARVFSMYGLTESSTRVSYLPPELLATKPGSVGRPLPGVEVAIRDDLGQVRPTGAVGEVHVRGPNVMQRYLGDPEATADVLHDGWLRTGDLGMLDPDGHLTLTGREKEIIKLAGERISPAEIEQVVATHPAVAEAAVVGAPDPLLGETVVAFVVPSGGATDVADLAAYCAARLAPHKIPRRFIPIDAVPRTPTGKVRRHVLRERLP